jgi:hypothetical protein
LFILKGLDRKSFVFNRRELLPAYGSGESALRHRVASSTRGSVLYSYLYFINLGTFTRQVLGISNAAGMNTLGSFWSGRGLDTFGAATIEGRWIILGRR